MNHRSKKTRKAFFGKILHFSLAVITSMTLLCGSEISVLAEPEETVEAQENQEAQQTAVSWPQGPEIFAETGVLIEASTGAVLYDKGCHQKMYPASITKIMTTMLALENGNLNDMVEFYHFDVYSLELGDANIARQEGELLSLRDTLYAVMLASANECANATGEYVARKSPEFQKRIDELKAKGEDYDEDKVAISVFADMMTERAKKAGAQGTHFSNPSGLFDENHYTTAYDMAMIARDAIKLDEFLKIESNTSHQIPVTNKNAETQMVYNRHKMLFPSNQNYYEGVLGGKTGYVDQSGSTLVTFANRNGMTLISVVMRSNGANVYNDTRMLLDYGFANFSLTNVAENDSKFSFNGLGSLPNLSKVFHSDSSLVELDTSGNIVLPNGAKISDCESKLTFDDEDILSDEKKIARLNYYYQDTRVGGADLLLNKSNESFTFGPAKEPVKVVEKKEKEKYIDINIWWLLGGVIALIGIIALVYYIHSIRIYSRRRSHYRGNNRRRSSVRNDGRPYSSRKRRR